jgi:hypothetical protein
LGSRSGNPRLQSDLDAKRQIIGFSGKFSMKRSNGMQTALTNALCALWAHRQKVPAKRPMVLSGNWTNGGAVTVVA